MNLRITVDRALHLDGWWLSRADSCDLRHVVRVSVWIRWLIAILCVFGLTYRSTFTDFAFSVYVMLLLTFIVLNAIAHCRSHSGKENSVIWLLIQSTLDVSLIAVGSAMSGGIGQFYFFLFYYPALAIFALTFPSVRLCAFWVTIVACAYILTSLPVVNGSDSLGYEDGALIAGITVMYVIVFPISLVSKLRQIRLRNAVERERVSRQEGIELSKTVHDTTAQSAYMMALCVERLQRLIDPSNEAQAAVLQAMRKVSDLAVWELRHPMGRGSIVEGRELSRTLESHAETFTTITAVPAYITLQGKEPRLPTEVKARLFSIAHNAVTNAYRHSNATRILIDLEFGRTSICLEVSDDGEGLPDDYLSRGYGFENMRAEAAKMKGQLLVNSGDESSGTKITCVVPNISESGVQDNAVR